MNLPPDLDATNTKTTTPTNAKRLKSFAASAPKLATHIETAMQVKKDASFLYESSSSLDESSDEEKLQPPKMEEEAPLQTKEPSDNQKMKKEESSPESALAPHNKQTQQERLATPRPSNPSTSSDFQWTIPDQPLQEKRRPPPIIY